MKKSKADLEKELSTLESLLDDVSAIDNPKFFNQICEDIDEVQTLIQEYDNSEL